MCKRFTLMGDWEEVYAFLAVINDAPFPPRYNIAPTQPILMAIAAESKDPGSNLPGRRALLVRWGLIPAWAKDPKSLPLFFNARSETAVGMNSFKAAFRHRRALIPASGFYEWKTIGKTKQPYFVRPRHGGLIAFAALMETYANPNGSEVDTGAILTTAASRDIAPIHDRMPVIVQPEDFSRWLDCRRQEPRDVADLLRPTEPGYFEAVPISDLVNTVKNIGPEIQAGVPLQPQENSQTKAEAEDGDQLSLL